MSVIGWRHRVLVLVAVAFVLLAVGCSSDNSTDAGGGVSSDPGSGVASGPEPTSGAPIVGTVEPPSSTCLDLVELGEEVELIVAADILRGMDTAGDSDLADALVGWIELADWLQSGGSGLAPVEAAQYGEMLAAFEFYALSECGVDNLFTAGPPLGYEPPGGDSEDQ